LGSAVTILALPTAAILLLHAHALEVGLLAGLQRLPFLFLSLHAGAWLDRVQRRPVMIACDLARAAVLASVPIAAGLHHLVLGQLYLVALLLGVFTVFFDVGYLSLLPSLLSRRELMSGNQLMQAAHATSDLAGPGLGGLLIQVFGAASAITVDAASYLVSAAMLFWIRTGDAKPAAREPTPMLTEIAEGLRWVFTHPLLRSQLLGLTLGGFGLFMAIPQLLVYAYGSLRLGPGVVGAVFVLEGGAGLLGLWASPRVTAGLGLGRTMWVTQVGMGVAFMAIPLASLGAPAVVLGATMLLTGFSALIQDVNQVTLRQSLTPDRLQGRMNAVFRLFFWGSWPLASFSGGFLASAIGAAPAILAGGALTVAAALVIALSPIGRIAAHPAPED
jgi:predicted MFS family arabinose efflux permease